MAKGRKRNPKGTVTISIGTLLKDVEKIAAEDRRSISQQIAVIIREWLELHKLTDKSTSAEPA